MAELFPHVHKLLNALRNELIVLCFDCFSDLVISLVEIRLRLELLLPSLRNPYLALFLKVDLFLLFPLLDSFPGALD